MGDLVEGLTVGDLDEGLAVGDLDEGIAVVGLDEGLVIGHVKESAVGFIVVLDTTSSVPKLFGDLRTYNPCSIPETTTLPEGKYG